jgi:uncharacterized protein (DUF302 family)
MRTVVSSSGYGETLGHVLDGIGRRGLTVFAQIDHAAAAREAGMDLRDEMVVMFGNPRAGTPLMRQDPRVGIELPPRLLIWNDREHTILGYEDPRDLAGSYNITAHVATLDAMSSLLDQLAHEAAAAAST